MSCAFGNFGNQGMVLKDKQLMAIHKKKNCEDVLYLLATG